MTKPGCYEVLGIDQSATAAEIRKAFRRLAVKAHPDKGGSSEKFVELKKALEEALAALQPSKTERSVFNVNLEALDPFDDPEYEKRYIFFEPSHQNSADFERHMHAKGCKRCNGRGYISKIVEPDKGFLGMQELLCRCQIIGVRKPSGK